MRSSLRGLRRMPLIDGASLSQFTIFAYLLTGNVWFTSGVHAGANFGTYSISGLWHAGAIISVAGQSAFPNWVAVTLMQAAIGMAYFITRLYKTRHSHSPPGAV